MTYFFMPLSFAALALALFPQAPAIAEYNQEVTPTHPSRRRKAAPDEAAPDVGTHFEELPPTPGEAAAARLDDDPESDGQY